MHDVIEFVEHIHPLKPFEIAYASTCDSPWRLPNSLIAAITYSTLSLMSVLSIVAYFSIKIKEYFQRSKWIGEKRMEMNGNNHYLRTLYAAKSNGNGANMEQIGKRKIAKVFVYKALAIVAM